MGKRIRGEGSVYQRKDGRWTAVIPLDDGKKKFIYCKTQRDALKELQLATQAKLQGTLLTTGDQTVAVFLSSWLKDTAQYRVQEKTYIRYCELVELHMIPLLGKVKLQKLAPPHVQKLYAQKREEGYAPQTIRHIHRLLHRALNDAVKWSLVARNVCDIVDPPRVPKREMRVLTVEQAQHLLEVAKEDPLEALYVLALTTGMRQSELLALQWGDINFTQGALQVQRKIAHIRGKGFVISEPKTAKSRRNIPLASHTLEVLKRHRIRQHEQRLAAGEDWDDQGFLFTNAVGKPIEAGNLLRRSFWPLLAKAEVPKIRFHDLRHSCATLLLTMGVHPKVVQERLGHSQISVTLDIYSHVLPSLQEDAAQRLDAHFSIRKHSND